MNRSVAYGRIVLTALVVAAIAGILVLDRASASVPLGVPAFTSPATITNTYQPFEPGAVKVYRGSKGGTKSVVVDNYLTATRSFSFDGDDVECRILEEVEFEDGALVEISRNYFAQADNGAVYDFGEVVDVYENGIITSHEGSWLVGGPTEPSDPVTAADAVTPTIFMPANPEKRDVFKQEDVFPIADETDTIVSTGVRIHVAAGKFTECIRVLETSSIDTGTETKWYAPHVGVVKARARGEWLDLVASTLE